MTTLRLRDRTLVARPGRPLLMGIVNAGPDSFSDDRRRTTLADQLAHARSLVADGADLIDVGAESGVTYTSVSDIEVEISRVVPLIAALADEGIALSVDTFKPAVAAAALAAGALIVNDVSGLMDPALAEVTAAAGGALVVLHTRAPPKQEHFADYGGDVVGDMVSFVRERCEVAMERGVADDQLIVDPGPDFAKTPAESVETLRGIDALRELGHPWLAAISNKYFVGAITGRAPARRLAGTLAALDFAAEHGAAIARVHDVAAAADFLAVRRVLDGHAEMPAFDGDDETLKWIRADES